MTKTKVEKFENTIEYQPGSVVSRVIMKKGNGNVTLFAFDEGEGLSEHTTPFDALVQILSGDAEVKVGGETFTVGPGESILMPANVPHALQATSRFKMLLTMIKS
jgi:quercetin dioxygenase-like cupin family protein